MKKSYTVFFGGMVVGSALYFLIDTGFHYLKEVRALPSDITPIRLSRFTSTTGALIDPLFAVGNSSNDTPKVWQPLQKELQDLIDQRTKQGDIIEASVYFKDLNKSQGFNINIDALYYPASLLKVPLMITYFKVAEKNPAILRDSIYYGGAKDANIEESIRSPIQLEAQKTYTVEELIEHMIKYSDNNAAQLLIDHLNDIHESDAFNTLFKDLGFTELGSDDYLTARKYSLFFRVLYNATYLSREYSEKALKLLTQTDFSQGIEGGVPNPITIAQKFGEYTVKNIDGVLIKRELHNCGIVYYPEKPYLLCVMTKGKNFRLLENLIIDISRAVYKNAETSK